MDYRYYRSEQGASFESLTQHVKFALSQRVATLSRDRWDTSSCEIRRGAVGDGTDPVFDWFVHTKYI
jgi:hypothetical protein